MKKKSLSLVVTGCLLVALLTTPVLSFGANNGSCSLYSIQKAGCQQMINQYPQKIVKKCLENRKFSRYRICRINTSAVKPVPEAGKENSSQSTGNQLSSSVSAMEKQVAESVNKERSRKGLSALALNEDLSAVARVKAREMAEKGYFSHTSPTYGSPAEMVKSFGLTYRFVGENIAKGYLSADTVMDGWMRSSGHKANILSTSYSEIGVGCAADEKGTLYWVQLFRK